MIILDTNVVSETLKPQPDSKVLAWLDNQTFETLYLTSITVAELLFGVAVLPEGKRKQQLSSAIDEIFSMYKNRLLPFDTEAARHFASLALIARQSGFGFPTPDGYIAGIAAKHGYIVASRDTSPFESVGVKIVNPWL
jgi:predicted nucleic acid-binding protein